MAKTGWKRSLGTSKKEQGIETPKRPKPQRNFRGVKRVRGMGYGSDMLGGFALMSALMASSKLKRNKRSALKSGKKV